MHNFDEMLQLTSEMDDACYTAELTDLYLVGQWNNRKPLDENKILEIRVFNKEKEVKLFREDIGSPFRIRSLGNEGDFFDELQLLDVDQKETKGTEFVTTGGGHYEFPFLNLKIPAVRIRHYMKTYPRSGQVYIFDWRCVDFEEWRADVNEATRL